MKKFCLLLLFTATLYSFIQHTKDDKPRILIFSRTLGWHHNSIPNAIAAVKELAESKGYVVDTTTNPTLFTDQELIKYKAVVFCNTTGNVLNGEQQTAFERFIQAGGGYVGIHSAADTEYDWPWYGSLAGAYFESHPNNPNVRAATVTMHDSLFVQAMPSNWSSMDEWYNYKNFYPDLKIIASIDESTYEGGTNGANHPIAWFHDYDGGRAFYLGMGHTEESYSDPKLLSILNAGLEYAIGKVSLDYKKAYAKATPDQTRFTKKVLVDNLNSPMELSIADNGNIYFTQLFGQLSMLDNKTKKVSLISQLKVTTTGGTGLIGIALDPAFLTNHFVYLYYSPADQKDEPIYFNLSRFTLNGLKLDLRSEKVLLRVPVQKNSGSHHGGSLAWDKDGNLYLSTGDSSNPFASDGFAPLDERPGAEHYSLDAQRGPANTNDFKGKILRIHPEANGTYTIPKGNLFAVGTNKTRPEIYVMGVRNPYRIAVNPRSSVLYWGDIGPDAGENTARGPRGYDEFNQAKEAGNYGWPYFIAENYPYSKWDFVTNKPGPFNDADKPVNNSPNNTGLNELPPARPAMIWYPYAASQEFPELGIGGRSSMAGSFYQFRNNRSVSQFPSYYDGSLFVFDWMRNWVRCLQFDSSENYIRSEAFMPSNGDFRRPIDLAFSSDGIMYMLEYGSVYGMANKDAQLVRIDYNNGNRAPLAKAYVVDSVYMKRLNETSMLTSDNKIFPMAKEIAGAVPFRIKLSGSLSKDLDDDDMISYAWMFDGKTITANSKEVIHTFTKPGLYKTILKVSDRNGRSSYDTVIVRAGNSKPVINVVADRNLSFASNDVSLNYSVNVTDKEDPRIDYKKLKTYFVYNRQPVSNEVVAKDINALNSTTNTTGKNLFMTSDCQSCHQQKQTAVGPSLVAIANRYKSQKGSVETLASKVIRGGGGSWGTEHVMNAHPQLSQSETQEIIRYIFSLTDKQVKLNSLPRSGTIKFNFKPTEPQGQYTFFSSYTDNGGKIIGPLTSQLFTSIRNNKVRAVDADVYSGFPRFRDNLSEGPHKSYLLFKNIDLSKLTSLDISFASANVTGEIELRIDSRAGKIVGSKSYTSTTSWDKFELINVPFIEPLSGKHDLYIYGISKPMQQGNVIRFKEITFN